MVTVGVVDSHGRSVSGGSPIGRSSVGKGDYGLGGNDNTTGDCVD